MSETTAPLNYNRFPPTAIKAHIARAATLEDAEAIFAQARPTPMALEAITARREGRPVNSPSPRPAPQPKPRKAPAKATKTRPPKTSAEHAPAGITVVGVDAQAAVVAGLVKSSGGKIPALRDFNERPPSQTSIPKWLSDIIEPLGLNVCRIETAMLSTDPRSSGQERYVVPITAETLPQYPREYLDERGVARWKDQTWCVGYKENFDRDRERNRKQHNEKTDAINPKRRTQKGTTQRGTAIGAVDMGITPGIRTNNPLRPDIGPGTVNKSLDRALSGAQ